MVVNRAYNVCKDMQDNHYRQLKELLEKRNLSIKEKVVSKHKEAFEWAQNNTKQLAAGAMGSLLLLTTPVVGFLPKPESTQNSQFVDVPDHLFVVSDVKKYLPDMGKQLLPQQEEKVADVLTQYYGFSVKPELNGFRLNTTYGYIGLEQHLKRYPGDSMEDRISDSPQAMEFAKNGIAPSRGGFGYFARSKNEMTEETRLREQYYIAVQTFLAPGFSERKRDYLNFFKFRKMLVVNPENGRAVVADIADAGPAVWTGKQLGGSPEVMHHLERVDGSLKGPVLYFFIDDPEDKIPLGPIEPVSRVMSLKTE
jgi:hypothetical protein